MQPTVSQWCLGLIKPTLPRPFFFVLRQTWSHFSICCLDHAAVTKGERERGREGKQLHLGGPHRFFLVHSLGRRREERGERREERGERRVTQSVQSLSEDRGRHHFLSFSLPLFQANLADVARVW